MRVAEATIAGLIAGGVLLAVALRIAADPVLLSALGFLVAFFAVLVRPAKPARRHIHERSRK